MTQRRNLLVISLALGSSPWPWEEVADAIEPIDVFEGAELHRQEQLCVPLVPANTYWYLSAVPELFALAVERLEQSKGERS